jgi:hypothetical protein
MITELSALDDSAPVKKARFIAAYHYAREEGLTERVIRSGWRAAGIYPWNPVKAINSSQVKNQLKSPPRRKRARSLDYDVTRTPQKPQHLFEAVRSITKAAKIPRMQRLVIQKAGKAIGRLNAIQAGHEATIQRQKAEIESLQAKKPRKRITIDPNLRFANIESIKKALDKAAALEAQRKGKDAKFIAQKAVEASSNMTLESMTFEWQLE